MGLTQWFSTTMPRHIRVPFAIRWGAASYCTQFVYSGKKVECCDIISIRLSECGVPNDHYGTRVPNDHYGTVTSVTLVLIIKNKLKSTQVLKFGRLLVKQGRSQGGGKEGNSYPKNIFSYH